jgi:retron-type reverse transcriptase
VIRFIKHRVADHRILGVIQKRHKAGVMEEGKWSDTEMGTPQGSVISPLLGNIYLHCAPHDCFASACSGEKSRMRQ